MDPWGLDLWDGRVGFLCLAGFLGAHDLSQLPVSPPATWAISQSCGNPFLPPVLHLIQGSSRTYHWRPQDLAGLSPKDACFFHIWGPNMSRCQLL